MKKTKYDKIWEVLNKLKEKNDEDKKNTSFRSNHYTSTNVLFDILEGNSFWASNVRFSNDATEERLIITSNIECRDDYIICFCSENDMLSQWRGYCHSGGAAINLYLYYNQTYSILHSDYETSNEFELYDNALLPVYYFNNNDIWSNIEKRINDAINEKGYSDCLSIEDIIPYIKNDCFYEEKESRLAFSNDKGRLSKCIRFRTLSDGVKVPYIVVQYGDIGKMKGTCRTNPKDFDDIFIKEHCYTNEPIWIAEGNNQEEVYYETVERVKKFIVDYDPPYDVKIFCRGKLPIEEIMVAPTYDKDRKAEQIKRFCKSKYWLNRVNVNVSKIPYIKPQL